MKKMLRVLVLGAVTAMVMTVGSVSIFAQGDICSDFEANQALYAKYTDNYNGPINESTLAKREMAVAAAKEYVEKYSACPDVAAQVEYLKKAGPALQKKIEAAKVEIDKGKLRDAFDKAMTSKNTSQIFSSGKALIANEPDFLDVIIVLASVGLDEAAEKKNDTYNNEAINYANMAISKLNSNVKSETGKFGAYQYEYDTKENALGWMDYTIGLIKYYRQNKKDEGLDYFYRSIQHNSETKDKSFIYELIGAKYQEKAVEIKDEIVKMFQDTGGKETFETKSKDALLRGYIDRAMDAYAKAYDLTKAGEAKNAIFDKMKGLYRFRYETPETTFTDAELKTRLETFVASAKSKALPDPNSEVQPVNPPVKEEETPKESTDSPSTDSSTSMSKTEKKTEAKTNGVKPKN
jgi:hypothetical protein